VTTFSEVIMDQAGLVGLIRQLHGHGIVLISICLVRAQSDAPSMEKKASALSETEDRQNAKSNIRR
jgi:hypothetical protein